MPPPDSLKGGAATAAVYRQRREMQAAEVAHIQRERLCGLCDRLDPPRGLWTLTVHGREAPFNLCIVCVLRIWGDAEYGWLVRDAEVQLSIADLRWLRGFMPRRYGETRSPPSA